VDGHEERRHRMVSEQIAGRGVTDPAVLAAMRRIPRERFVGAGLEAFAYDDRPLPIGEGQTISQPFVVALMAEAAALGPKDHVLEVGAGSGYAAAVLGHLAGHVIAIERRETLARLAARRLAELGLGNVELRVGDGSTGAPDDAPFDAILVAAGAPVVPAALRDQLAIGGRLVLPVGDANQQRLVKVTRRTDTEYDEQSLGLVAFVPLIGEQGWSEER
jgi:protein-L-isoaspartate(D-aspartate) O-methyltransferase